MTRRKANPATGDGGVQRVVASEEHNDLTKITGTLQTGATGATGAT